MNLTSRIYRIVFFLVLLTGVSYSDIGIRGGVGIFVPQDSTFDETNANSFMLELKINLGEYLFIHGGSKLIKVRETTVPITTSPEVSVPITIGEYKHKIDAISFYCGSGVGLELCKGGTGIYPYISGSVGFISPLVQQELIYKAFSETTSSKKLIAERHWEMMLVASTGIEIRVVGIGIIVQGDYIYGTKIQYNPVIIEEYEIFPGGEIETSGWAIYIGLSLN